MGEVIKRALTPTVGQNSLSKWLESPELSNPIRNQSTELQIVQEIQPFQVKRRFQSLTSSLSGGDTIAFFQGRVPVDENWFIEMLTIGHNAAAGRRVFNMTVETPGLMLDPLVVARVAILAGATASAQAMPLIGGALYQIAVDDLFNQPNGLKVSPGSQITVQNLSGLAAGDNVNFKMRYVQRPLPLEEELSDFLIAGQA